MTEIPEVAVQRPMPTIGKWRPAKALRDGWQILKTEHYEATGNEEWLTIARAMQITAPVRMVNLRFDDDTRLGCLTDPAEGYEFFTRTPTEAARAAAADGGE